MKEKTQVALLIFLGLFFAVITIGYNVFFTLPINIYQVGAATSTTDKSEIVTDAQGTSDENNNADTDTKEVENTEDPEENDTAGEMQVSGLININSATMELLTELPGIGNVTAESIILYREENGPFQSIEELLDVSGIGEKKFEAIKALITI